MNRIRKNDEVQVISGPDKGKKGKVLNVLSNDRVVVAGVQLIKRHTAPSQGNEGGIIEKEASIHISNVALIDTETGKPTKISYEIRDGKKVRISKKSGAIINENLDSNKG